MLFPLQIVIGLLSFGQYQGLRLGFNPTHRKVEESGFFENPWRLSNLDGAQNFYEFNGGAGQEDQRFVHYTDLMGIYDYPWIANLQIMKKVKYLVGPPCSGTLIKSNLIVTAAHCLFDANRRQILLNTGSHIMQAKIGYKAQYKNYMVEKYVIHPKFEIRHLKHDIAVLKLKDSVSMDGVKPEHLVLPLIGFSRMAKEEYFPLYEESFIPMQKDEICSNYRPFQKLFDPTCHLCIGNSEKNENKDICQSDSGGPVMYYAHENSKWHLAGIVLTGEPLYCGLPNGLNIVLNIVEYKTWIEEQMYVAH